MLALIAPLADPAVGNAGSRAAGRHPTEPTATPWDAELAAAGYRRDLRVDEELTLDELLHDLSQLRKPGC